MVIKARTEFASALNQVCAERGIEPEVVLTTIQDAILAAYRRDFGLEEDFEYEAEINPETGETQIYHWPEGKKKKKKNITPPGFGRIAATVARQVLLQKIREAEKSAILDEYSKRIGTLVNGLVLRFDGPNVIVDIGKAEGVMPPQEQVRSERYRLNQRLTFFIKEIRDSTRGREVVVSRADKDLVESLFRREVPEVASGAVEMKAVAREPGSRTKIAVFSNQSGVDPVGSCVGQKGVRVQAVINELEGEKIDVIQFNEDSERFIIAALSPAEGVRAEVDEKKKVAKIDVPEDQLSLAIGAEGQNVRLAAKLTGYKLDLKGGRKPAKKTTKPVKKEKDSKLVKAGLSKRVAGALEGAGITTVAKLKKTSEKKLAEIKGLGPKGIKEISKTLKEA
jgi:N utilization substance protein A